MSIIRCFQLKLLSPLYGVSVMILMSPLYGIFSGGSLVKKTAVTSGKVNQRTVSSRMYWAFHQ